MSEEWLTPFPPNVTMTLIFGGVPLTRTPPPACHSHAHTHKGPCVAITIAHELL